MLHQAWDSRSPFPTEQILTAFGETENPYLKATYLSLIANQGIDPISLGIDTAALQDAHPILREALARGLSNNPDSIEALTELAKDTRRSVRLAAVDSLMALGAQPLDASERQALMLANADRPQARLQLAQAASLDGDSDLAFRHLRTAASFDSHNSGVYYQGAVILASGGFLTSAQSFLRTAPAEAQTDGWTDYAHGLIWAELQDLPNAIASLKSAVAKDPLQDRWWYNLVAAYLQSGMQGEARNALSTARRANPNSQILNTIAL